MRVRSRRVHTAPEFGLAEIIRADVGARRKPALRQPGFRSGLSEVRTDARPPDGLPVFDLHLVGLRRWTFQGNPSGRHSGCTLKGLHIPCIANRDRRNGCKTRPAVLIWLSWRWLLVSAIADSCDARRLPWTWRSLTAG